MKALLRALILTLLFALPLPAHAEFMAKPDSDAFFDTLYGSEQGSTVVLAFALAYNVDTFLYFDADGGRSYGYANIADYPTPGSSSGLAERLERQLTFWMLKGSGYLDRERLKTEVSRIIGTARHILISRDGEEAYRIDRRSALETIGDFTGLAPVTTIRIILDPVLVTPEEAADLGRSLEFSAF